MTELTMEDAMKGLYAAAKVKSDLIKSKTIMGVAKCPVCEDGQIMVAIAGPRNHMRYKCTGCAIEGME